MKRIFLLLVAAAVAAQNQAPVKRTLTVDWIMQGPELYGHAPQAVRWSRDSQRVYFEWKAYNAPVLADPDTYVVNRDGTALRKLSPEEARHAAPEGGQLSKDQSATVFTERGDVFVYDHTEQRRVAVTRTADAESGARFFGSARQVTYQRGGNLFLHSLDDGIVEQLTEIRPAGTPPPADERKGTESQELIRKEERGLLSIIEQRAAKREADEARRRKENPRKPWTLPARHTVSQMALTPDGKFVVAVIAEAGERNRRTIVPNFVTESAYTEDISARDKVGDARTRNKLAIFDRETGAQRWVEFGAKERAADFALPQFSDESGAAYFVARAADNKDAWLVALDAATAKTREIANVHDDAWISFGTPNGWLDGDRIYFVSERDGFAHLYAVPYAGGEAKQLTSGKWEIRRLALSSDRKIFYLTTSEASAAESHLYAMQASGGERKRLTTKPGGHETTVAPDGTVASVYSYADTPPELWVANRRVTSSPAPEFSSYPWTDPPVVEIPARDGAKVPARLYKPAGWKKGGPLVIFVHGAGYLQNAHKRWSQYAREYMFHHLLMDKGYLVLDLDYRASAGYGRDWRTAVYRYMGGKDLDDQVDAVKWAVSEHGADPKRVGLYGGSYGGFITLMALFTQPEVFQAGAALRPVTDWAHYNQGYTSNILNLPQADREAYTRSSPIYHAAGLKGHLLIAHGMVDVNVHYQDSVRLVQKLIELRKENWEFASYPVEDHGFVQPTSWADEYKRILKLFDSTIGKPQPEAAAPRSQKKR
jgi:dipeptidyl aminopeptidase/acylaminoacyl peptidase